MAFLLLRQVSSRFAIGRSMFLRQMTSSSFEVSSQSNFHPVLFRQLPSQPTTVSYERDWSQSGTERKGSLLLSLSALMGFVLAEETRKYSEADSEKVTQEADELYKQKKFQQCHDMLEAYMAAVPYDEENAWRYSRACYELAQYLKEPEKKKLIYKSNTEAKNALLLNDAHPQIHKWVGISTGAVTDYEGITSKIQLSFQIKEHFEQTIKLNPKDPYGYYLLGKWRWTFAEMPWYTRSIASTFFATPPVSTYEEALESFLHAENIQEGFYLDNKVMIAKCYQKIGDQTNARLWFERVVRCEPQYLKDHDLVKEAAENLRAM